AGVVPAGKGNGGGSSRSCCETRRRAAGQSEKVAVPSRAWPPARTRPANHSALFGDQGRAFAQMMLAPIPWPRHLPDLATLPRWEVGSSVLGAPEGTPVERRASPQSIAAWVCPRQEEARRDAPPSASATVRPIRLPSRGGRWARDDAQRYWSLGSGPDRSRVQ